MDLLSPTTLFVFRTSGGYTHLMNIIIIIIIIIYCDYDRYSHARLPFLATFCLPCLALPYLTLPYLTLPDLPITRLLSQLPSRKKKKYKRTRRAASKQQQITRTKKRKKKNHVPNSHHHHHHQRNLTTTPLLPSQRPHPPLSPQHHLRPNSSPDFFRFLYSSSLFLLFLRYSYLRCCCFISPTTRRKIE